MINHDLSGWYSNCTSLLYHAELVFTCHGYTWLSLYIACNYMYLGLYYILLFYKALVIELKSFNSIN